MNTPNHPTKEQREAFLKEVREVCERHGIGISCDNSYGPFQLYSVADYKATNGGDPLYDYFFGQFDD